MYIFVKGQETVFNLTDRFSISVKLRENRRYLSNIPCKAIQKDYSQHYLFRRAGSSFFTYLYSIGYDSRPFSSIYPILPPFYPLVNTASNSISGGRMSRLWADICPPGLRAVRFACRARRFRSPSVEDRPMSSSILLM